MDCFEGFEVSGFDLVSHPLGIDDFFYYFAEKYCIISYKQKWGQMNPETRNLETSSQISHI